MADIEQIETLIQWNEPAAAAGKRHEVGEIAKISRKDVFDLDDLIARGTVRIVATSTPEKITGPAITQIVNAMTRPPASDSQSPEAKN